MLSFAWLLFVLACAFLMGFSVNQGSTCAVTAAKELVYQRHATMLSGFAVAVGTAGMVCLPLGWLLGNSAHLASGTTISVSLVLGAVLLGIGAVINDACLFGTLSRIGHGEVRFLALPLGLALGFAIADRQTVLIPGAMIANPLKHPSPAGLIMVAGFMLLALLAWRWLGRGERPHRFKDWPLRRAMVVLGLCGALLFTLAPGWTYADAVRHAVGREGAPMALSFGALIAAAAALLGALASAVSARSFVLQLPTVITLLRSLIGGMIMAFGGTLIPGGNDTLLLAAIPAATTSGITAYLILSLTVPLLLIGVRQVQLFR